jgi:hypothetical protein
VLAWFVLILSAKEHDLALANLMDVARGFFTLQASRYR